MIKRCCACFVFVSVVLLRPYPSKADDWLGKSGPKIQIMPKSPDPQKFIVYSEIIPQPVLSERTAEATLFDFPWPLTATKENGQWLQIEDDCSMSREPIKGWINKEQIVKLDSAAETYNTELAKNQTGPYAAAYHWLLGVVLENQKQKTAALYQYEVAQKLSDPISKGHALWGIARLSADLYQGETVGPTAKYADNVDCKFSAAETQLIKESDEDSVPPSLYTDWGLALEKALPKFETIGAAVFSMQKCKTNPVSYPGGTNDEEEDEKYAVCLLLRIQGEYRNAEDLPVGGKSGSDEIAEEDASNWDLPHRLLGSLYGRYRVKRKAMSQSTLYVDLDGKKYPGEHSVNADDELARALRRKPNSLETHNERAKLQFGYFRDAHNSTAAALFPSEELNSAKTQFEEFETAESYSNDIKTAHDNLVEYLHEPIPHAKPDSPATAEKLQNALMALDKAIVNRQLAISDAEAAANDAANARLTLKYLLLRTRLAVAMERFRVVRLSLDGDKTGACKALDAAANALEKAIKDPQKSNLAYVLTELAEAQATCKPFLLAPNEEAAAWQLAYKEATTAAQLAKFRSSESADLLAQICYLAPVDPPPLPIVGTLESGAATAHPMLQEAVRFEKLAAEYAPDNATRLTLMNQYICWYNELEGTPLAYLSPLVDVTELKMIPPQSTNESWQGIAAIALNAQQLTSKSIIALQSVTPRPTVSVRPTAPETGPSFEVAAPRPRTYTPPPMPANNSGFAVH
jgi:hypothetical protein